MVRINNEHIIVSLMEFGFERVDKELFTFVLGKLTLDNRKLNSFILIDEPNCSFFDEVMVYDEFGWHLKDDLTLNSKYYENSDVTIRQILNIQPELVNYFNTIDFREAILNKIHSYGISEVNELGNHFCDKEKAIIKEMFKIEESKKEVVETLPKEKLLSRVLFIPRKDL